MMPYDWKPYVPAAARRANAKRIMASRRKRGLPVEPVEVKGRIIARSFWGGAWCDHLHKFSDYANRMPRGATYVRNGSVCHLAIESGEVNALVMGSELYEVRIRVKPLAAKRWRDVKQRCAGSIGSLLELLEGRLSDHVMACVTDPRDGLFPLPEEIRLECSCPDWATMCKHLAAALYGVGARLDHQPELLFTLRGVDQRELVADESNAIDAVTAAVGRAAAHHQRLDANVLGDVFGIEIETAGRDALPRRPRGRTTGKATGARRTVAGAPRSKPKPKPKPVRERAWTAARVRRLRSRLDMSRSAFARHVGVSSATVKNWEEARGPLRLQARTVAALSRCDGASQKRQPDK
ncbi:MAG: hypothetical protein ACR2RL_15140 [Gammaproteobacteria bacterium]